MRDSKGTPVLVGVAVGVVVVAAAALYMFVFSVVPGMRWVRFLIAIGAAALLAAVYITVRARQQEINEEDPDDYRKY